MSFQSPSSILLKPLVFGCLLLQALVTRDCASAGSPAFQVSPSQVHLQGNFARSQLVVAELDSTRRVTAHSADLTQAAQYESSDVGVVSITQSGRLVAVGNGDAKLKVIVGRTSVEVPVRVSGVESAPQVGFAESVQPILSKRGCNMGACHASQYGKGGFKLSVFAFQPSSDRTAIVRERYQRRINLIDPEKSLLLQKPTLQVPHGGGKRLELNSVDYQILAAWIACGAPSPQKPPTLTKLHVTPKRRVGPIGMQQQLRVAAEYKDGTIQDVTGWAKFDSMDEAVLGIDPDGMVTAISEGQAPIMVRFEGQTQISMFVVPYNTHANLKDWKDNNFVDELASAKFRELGIEPSPLCDDATFIRRAFVDSIGTSPTLQETVSFLESTEPDKRLQLIDGLLGLTGDADRDIYDDRYAAYWTLKWSDLIRNSSNKVGEQGMWALHNWIKAAFRTNKPFDRFVYELVTAKGSIYNNGPANYYRINNNSSLLTEATVQLFLGIRLECAKCHHHPFEKYSQSDYNGIARFFSQVRSKNSEEFGLFGRETVVTVQPNPKAKATPLDGEPVAHPLDIRIPLAKWLTSKQNAFFAESVVNRYMSYLLGRGLVEPVDDLRSTNPPTNVALMDALAQRFSDSGYDLKQLIRTIMISRLYQLDSRLTPANAGDTKFYSHYQVKRLLAEPLLDAIDQATAVQTKFKSLPIGTRAIDLPDAGDTYPNYFLTTFAKPRRASVCECERTPDENLAQALHTLNGDILAAKISNKSGRVASLLKEQMSHVDIVKELYLVTLCRYPTEAEALASRQFLKESPNPQEAYEDLLWALINSKQFLFVH